MILGSAQFREAVRYEMNLIEAALMKPGALEDPEGRRLAEQLHRKLQSYFQTLAYDVNRIEWKDLFAKFEQAADIDSLVKRYRDPKTGKLTPDAFQAARLEAMERIKPHVAAHNQALHKVIADNIAQSYQGGNKNTWKAMPNVGPNDQLPPDAKLKRIGDTIGLKQRALDWAKEHAGKLVTSIDETTREQIAKIVAENISDGKGLGVARDRIMKELSVDMPESRALMIARTESCGAWNRGTLDGLKAKGMKWKKIVTHDPCPICIYIKRAGPVPIDQPFPRPSKRGGKRSKMTDDQHPPFHPRCYCSLVGALPPKDVVEPGAKPDVIDVPVPNPKPVTPQIPEPTPVAPVIAPPAAPTPVPAPTSPVAPTKPWTNQATIADAEIHAKGLFPHMEFEFTGAHIDAINPTMEQFTELSKRYPEVSSVIQYVGTRTNSHQYAGGWTRAIASHNSSENIIGINPAYYSDAVALRSAVDTAAAVRHFAVGSAKAGIKWLITHEFGHALHAYVVKIKPYFSDIDWPDGFGSVDGTLQLLRTEPRAVDSIDLSHYGIKNIRETFAESFASMVLAEEANKTEFVRRFEKLLKIHSESGMITDTKLTNELSPEELSTAKTVRDELKRELGLT